MPKGYAKSKHKALYNRKATKATKTKTRPKVKLLPKFRCTVEFTLPAGASRKAALDYVEAAVRSHSGSLMAGQDPMFDLERDTIHVKRYRTPSV